MNTEPIPNDSLTALIVSRLDERRKKVERMEEMERRLAARPKLRRHAISAVAACIVGLVVLAPLAQKAPDLGRYTPTAVDTDFRAGADASIQTLNSLIMEKDYQAAMPVAEQLLAQSDETLRNLDSQADNEPEVAEELEYELLLERQLNSQLRWACIMLLVKAEQYTSAEKELRHYMKHPDWCENADQAQALADALEEKEKNIFEKWVTFYYNLLE